MDLCVFVIVGYNMTGDDIKHWQAFCNGDNSAMERLYAGHSRDLYSFCLYQCGDHMASEDFVQEAYLKLIAQRSANSITRSVRSWLFVTARNLMLNRSRSSRHLSLDHLPENYLVIESNPDARISVLRILASLTADERELLLLREHQGFSIREIAEILGLSDENVRVRLFRIRKRIQYNERKLK